MTSYGEARKMRRGHSRPGYHPSVAWRWSLESGLRSKDSRAVRRRVVGKVPIEATRWRPILLHVPFLGGAPFNGAGDYFKEVTLGQWRKGHATGAATWQAVGSGACGQQFGVCSPESG